jgi:hypothetical protein
MDSTFVATTRDRGNYRPDPLTIAAGPSAAGPIRLLPQSMSPDPQATPGQSASVTLFEIGTISTNMMVIMNDLRYYVL